MTAWSPWCRAGWGAGNSKTAVCAAREPSEVKLVRGEEYFGSQCARPDDSYKSACHSATQQTELQSSQSVSQSVSFLLSLQAGRQNWEASERLARQWIVSNGSAAQSDVSMSEFCSRVVWQDHCMASESPLSSTTTTTTTSGQPSPLMAGKTATLETGGG